MIRALVWNVRGITNAKTRNRLRKLINLHKIDFLVIIEPKAQFSSSKELQHKLGMDNEMVQKEGKIWIMWKNQIQCKHIQCTVQTITVQVKHVNMQDDVIFTAVYAKCTRRERIQLWQDLQDIKPINLAWLVGGDFNIIAKDDEKRGGRRVNRRAQNDFNEAVDNCGLMEISCTGNKITWCNNRGGNARVQARLDRILCNTTWNNKFTNSHYRHLNRTFSNHAPMMLCVGDQSRRTNPFRFQDFWLKDETFMSLVESTWNQAVEGNYLQQVSKKLKALRSNLKKWNIERFGNIFKKTKEAEEAVEKAEIQFTENNKDENLINLKLARAKLIKHLADEEVYWRQRAHNKYLKEGDANTKFFHASVKGRRARNFIHRIRNEQGTWIDNKEEMNDHIVQFFKNQLSQEGPISIASQDLDHIPKLINEEDNEFLSRMPTQEEVKNAVWSLNKTSAAGPDGFNGNFFQKCWDIIQSDIVHVVQEFFCGRELPLSWTCASIVLLPKVHKPE